MTERKRAATFVVAPACLSLGRPASTFMFITAHALHLALVLRPLYDSWLAWLRISRQPLTCDGNPYLRPFFRSPGSQLGRKTMTGLLLFCCLCCHWCSTFLLMSADITDFQDVTPCSLVRLRCTYLHHIHQTIWRCILHRGVARG